MRSISNPYGMMRDQAQRTKLIKNICRLSSSNSTSVGYSGSFKNLRYAQNRRNPVGSLPLFFFAKSRICRTLRCCLGGGGLTAVTSSTDGLFFAAAVAVTAAGGADLPAGDGTEARRLLLAFLL